MRIERRETESRGHRIGYLTAGSGPPLLLASGTGQEAVTWFEYGYAERLAPDFTLIVPDPLGHGTSDRPHDVGAYAEPAVALDLLAPLDAEGIRQPVPVWGYSRGCRLALMLALEAPNRVERVVAGGAPLAVPSELVAGFVRPAIEPLTRGDWSGWWAAFGGSMDNADQRARIEQGADPVALAALLEAMADDPYEFELGSVRPPTLLYAGADDVFAPFMQEDARSLGTELVALEGLDHAGAYRELDRILPIALRFLS